MIWEMSCCSLMRSSLPDKIRRIRDLCRISFSSMRVRRDKVAEVGGRSESCSERANRI